jgi:hypothetical protein
MSNTQVPETIRQQITPGVFMSLGATDLMADRVHVKAPEYDTLTFRARILDKQHNKRVMRVQVILDPSDTYSIKVTYPKRGNPLETVVHYEVSDIYNDQLAEVLLRLDSVL